jgi:hypothetical protein
MAFRPNGGTNSKLAGYFFLIVTIFAVSTLTLSGRILPEQNHTSALEQNLDEFNMRERVHHTVSGLHCGAQGPSEELAAEMIYWEDIPKDANFQSPFMKEDPQYLTFEPDFGGWNNVRMGLETVIGMAFAMGRTLVLPPEMVRDRRVHANGINLFFKKKHTH